MSTPLQMLVEIHQAEQRLEFCYPVPEVLADAALHGVDRGALALLADRPGIRYAVVVDNSDADPVIVALGIRGALQDGAIVTCELRIPREKWDGVLFLEMLERHTIH